MNVHIIQHSTALANSPVTSALLQVSTSVPHGIVNSTSPMAGGVTMQQNTSGAAVSAVVASGIGAANQHAQNGCGNAAGTNGTGSQSSTPTQSITPPGNNAPKYGTLVPNRVFVGGISANTTEIELAQLFSAYGTVKATKIISDRAGVSKGYGFVTFETEDEAKRLQREADNIVLRERKLNIAPAIKKQPFSRPLDGTTPGSPPGSIPGLPTIPGLNGPTAAGFSFYPAAASNAAAAAAAAALSSPYFQNGGVTYYNPALTSSGAPNDPGNAAAGVYPAPGGLYPTAAAAHPHQPPPVSQAQAGSSMSASAAANMSAAVQQNIAAAQCAAAAAAGYPVLYPPAAAMYLPTCAAAGPQQYGYPPNHIPAYMPDTFCPETFSSDRFGARNCSTVPASTMQTVSSVRGVSTIPMPKPAPSPVQKASNEPTAIEARNYSEYWYPPAEPWTWSGFWYRPYVLPPCGIIPVGNEYSDNMLPFGREIEPDVNVADFESEKSFETSEVYPLGNISELVISVADEPFERRNNGAYVDVNSYRRGDSISRPRQHFEMETRNAVNDDGYSTESPFSDNFRIQQMNFRGFSNKRNQGKRYLHKKKNIANNNNEHVITLQQNTEIKSAGAQKNISENNVNSNRNNCCDTVENKSNCRNVYDRSSTTGNARK